MTTDHYTLEETMLAVSDDHRLFVQLWGAKDAQETMVFLHGGPGSGCSDKHKDLFDPLIHRVIFFDQRGCGKSLPYGSLVANDTDHLVSDITAITDSFGVEKFAITGGSWGSCLALIYAIRNPEKVTRMVLRGIFTGRKSEIDFLDKGEFRSFYPDVWERFVASVPAEAQHDPGAWHHEHMLGNDLELAKRSAYAYNDLEGSVISLDDRRRSEVYETIDPVGTIIECHYLVAGCFIPESYIIDNAANLTMPITLIQGRFDAVCPPFTAYDLSKVLPNGQLYWTTAGHSGTDRANWDLTKALLAN
jgi:proline iminopeptidase